MPYSNSLIANYWIYGYIGGHDMECDDDISVSCPEYLHILLMFCVVFVFFISFGIIRANIHEVVTEKKHFISWMFQTSTISWCTCYEHSEKYACLVPCCACLLWHIHGYSCCGLQVLWPSEATALLLLQRRKRKPQRVKLIDVFRFPTYFSLQYHATPELLNKFSDRIWYSLAVVLLPSI